MALGKKLVRETDTLHGGGLSVVRQMSAMLAGGGERWSFRGKRDGQSG